MGAFQKKGTIFYFIPKMKFDDFSRGKEKKCGVSDPLGRANYLVGWKGKAVVWKGVGRLGWVGRGHLLQV